MFDNAINTTAKNALAILNDIPEVNSFYLAGGTALALQISHRISYDLDFFSSKPFSPEAISRSINAKTQLKDVTIQENTLRGFYYDCEVSFFLYEYPLLNQTKTYANTNLASIKDIALMKLIAIGGRGIRKDFYDLYFILKDHIPINELIQSFDEKYTNNSLNKLHYLKSLTYFEIADQDESKLNLLKDVSWEKVKRYISQQAQTIFM